MKNWLFFFLLAAGFSCSESTAVAQHKLKPDEFEAMLAADKSIQLIDVRTPEEYAEGHIDGAKLINYYDKQFAEQISQLDQTKPVLVYCAVGGRSGSSAKKLVELGFPKVYDLAGGFNAWRAAGKKTVQ